MKNYGTKPEILLDQKLITQTNMMKNIWKSNLTRIMTCPPKTLELRNMIIVVRAMFHEYNKNYPQVFLNEYLHKLWMPEYDRTKMHEGIDIKKPSVLFVITATFLT